jgi:hypothetical protein
LLLLWKKVIPIVLKSQLVWLLFGLIIISFFLVILPRVNQSSDYCDDWYDAIFTLSC